MHIYSYSLLRGLARLFILAYAGSGTLARLFILAYAGSGTTIHTRFCGVWHNMHANSYNRHIKDEFGWKYSKEGPNVHVEAKVSKARRNHLGK
jgi:hypothetical protein